MPMLPSSRRPVPVQAAPRWRVLVGLCIAGLALSGCVTPDLGLGRARPPQTVTLAKTGVSVEAPAGFCVDAKTLRDTEAAGFVLFGHCAAMSGNPEDPRPDHRALLSATFGPDAEGKTDAARLERIAAFFETELGQSTLARSGKSEDVDLLSHRIEGNLLFLHIRDRSAVGQLPTAQSYWRALTGVAGRMAILTVMPVADGAVSDEAQIALLRRFAERLHAAN